MSSPSVLTAVTVPLERARVENRRACAEHLEKAQFVYDQLVPRLAKLRGAGVQVNIETPEQARDKAYRSLGAENFEAVKYLHGYWQRLKHTIGPDVTRKLLRLEYAEKAKRAKEREALERVAEREEQARIDRARAVVEVDHELRGGFELRHVEPAEHGEPLESLSRKVAQITENISRLAAELEDNTVAARLQEFSHKPDRERFAALQLLNNHLGVRAASARRDEALERELKQIQLDDERAQLARRLEVLDETSLQLVEEEALVIREETDVVRQTLASGSANSDAIDRQIEALEERRTKALTAGSLSKIVERELTKLGYRRISQMQTLTPADLRSRGGKRVLFASEDDPDAFVEMDAVDNSFAVQVVWAQEDSSSSASQRKLRYQQELCKAVDRIQEKMVTSAGATHVEINERAEPDAKAVPVRKGLAGVRRVNPSQQTARSMKR